MQVSWRILRFLFWPFLIIAGLNLENWASRKGYGHLFSDETRSARVIGDFIAFFTAPIWGYAVAFVVGAILTMYVVYSEERSIGKHGGPTDSKIRETSRYGSGLLARKSNWLIGGSFENEIDKCNRVFSLKELPMIPLEEVIDQGPMRDCYRNYLMLLWKNESLRSNPVAAQKHLTAMKKLGISK